MMERGNPWSNTPKAPYGDGDPNGEDHTYPEPVPPVLPTEPNPDAGRRGSDGVVK
jgi:hypothetical protein